MLWERVDGRVVRCCEVLNRAGFEAYPVGGCVRDLLRGQEPGDWDVTTKATPEQVIRLFEHTAPTGVKHGTVTVIMDGINIEVTTFRTETGYSDGRHPDEVRFTADLREDLARRDFTINAMALERDGTVIDPFGGQADLSGGIIRCVGDPNCRFEEDGLRMFRAVRFAAQHDLSIEENTLQAIKDKARTAGRVAAERVQTELEKTLCSSCPDMVGQFFELGLLSPWTCSQPADLAALTSLPPERLLRWAGLCGCLPQSGEFLNKMKLDGNTRRACKVGLQLLEQGLPNSPVGWRHALADWGEDACRCGAAMAGQSGALELLEQVLKEKPCIQAAQLALSGGELTELGLSGPRVGQMQKLLLTHVLDRPQDNRREILLKIVSKLI